MATRKVGDKEPNVSEGAYVDEDALVIGDVVLEEGVSVWPRALIRADDDRVTVRRGSAIMDMAFIEAPAGRPVTVGEGCIVSHGARLHGCTVGDRALVGIGATVLDGADIGERSVIAAGCVVPPGEKVEERSLLAGVPARRVRGTTEKDDERLARELTVLAEKARKYTSVQQHL
jgi:carbonic anhydrase/acetyltransferase-like protein (isoleucine patch superfamily)